MNINSSPTVKSNNALDTSNVQRVNGFTRVSSSSINSNQSEPASAQVLAAEKSQQLQIESFLRDLRARDREVRAHEAAHVAAGSGLIRGGPSFTYQTGPDGRPYAIGGEVQLDVSAVPGDPQATLAKASQIRQAALAPANPSAQDVSVAANATQLAARARIDLAIQRREEAELQQQSQSLGDAIDASEDANAATTEFQTSAPVSPDMAVNSAPLSSNDTPIKATNSFMTAPQTQAQPVFINQFV